MSLTTIAFIILGWFGLAGLFAWGWARFHRAMEDRAPFGPVDWSYRQRTRVDLLP